MTLGSVFRTLLRRTVNEQQLRALKHLRARLLHGGGLVGLARALGTDKEGGHHYASHYQHHFAPLRFKTLNILEIGIGGFENPRLGGRSLRMWKAYFPKSRIFGVDIHDKSHHDEHRIRTFRGSQVDEAFLHQVAREIGPLDIVIDDGSHLPAHVIKTLTVLFPLLSADGIYVVEDLQTSYWETVGGVDWGGSEDLAAPHTSMNFLKRLIDGLNYEEFASRAYTPTYFDRHIVAAHFYHNLVFLQKGRNDEGSNVLGKRFS